VLETAASGVARFDHNPTTFESLGLLIEESRSNLLTYSEQFDDAAWSKTDSSITANTIVAPDGTLTGDKLVEDTANGAHTFSQSLSATAQSYTLSIYVKKAERKYFQIFGRRDGTNYNGAMIDLDTGTVSAPTRPSTTSNASTTTVTSVGNGWWRVAMTYSYTTTGTTVIFFALTDGSQAYSYTGDDYSGVYIWGAQLEAGAFPTSYIQTVASQVTRSSDSASMTGTNFSSWYNQAAGTLYAEATRYQYGTAGTTTILQVDDGTTNNRILIGIGSTAALNQTLGVVVVGGTNQAVFLGTAQTGSKISFAYQQNNFANSLDGGTVQTDTSGTIPVVNQARIASNTSTTWNGHIRKIAYYPVRIQNAQLQALTI
jgi:hypothetical protein